MAMNTTNDQTPRKPIRCNEGTIKEARLRSCIKLLTPMEGRKFETPCTCASFERETDSLCPGCEETREEASREKFLHDMADAADEHERIIRERQRREDESIGVDWFYGGD